MDCEGVGDVEEGGDWDMKRGAPGGPSVQLKPTVAWPLEVVRLREAVPPQGPG